MLKSEKFLSSLALLAHTYTDFPNVSVLNVPYVPKKITIGLSASITSKVLNESK